MHNNKIDDIDFEAFINSTPDSEKVLSSLSEKICKYNVYDILCRLAALNCIPENQNKEVLTSGLIEELLSHPEIDYSTFPIMSHNRFKQIINELEKSSLITAIDPAEGPVVQSIIWKGNTFLCFPGMDKDSVFRLQMILDSLETLTFDNNDFWKEVMGIIVLTLSVQDLIARKQHLSEGYYVKQPSEKISVKTSAELTEIVSTISISNYSERIKNLATPFPDAVCCSFGQVKSDDYNHYTFYKNPFLYNEKKDSLIPLHIGILTEYTYLRIVELAEQYKIDGPLMDSYNKNIIDNCCKSLKMLGHYLVHEELIEEDNYSKELVFSAFESDFLIVEFIKEKVKADDVEIINEIIDGNRCIKLSDKIIKLGFDSSRLNYLIIFNTFVASTPYFFFNTSDLYGNGIALKPFELLCISINEYNNEDFIPRFSNEYSKINCPLRSFAHHPLDAIQFYVSNKYSFYRDDIDTRKASMTFSFGMSIVYIAKALENYSKTILPYYKKNTVVIVHEIDKRRNIFAYPSRNSIERCIKINNFIIWVITEKISSPIKQNVLNSLVDILSYWIGENSAQLAQYFHSFGVIPIVIKLPDDDEKYSFLRKTDSNNHTFSSIKEGYISISFTADDYWQLFRTDNIKEKELFVKTISCIFTLIGVQPPPIDYVSFSNPKKMLVDFSNITDYGYLEPVRIPFFPRSIHEDDIGNLLNEIGDYICNSTNKKRFYGDECVTITERIVSFLFEKIFSIFKKYDSSSILFLAYEDMENAIYESRMKERRLHKDILCYPEKKEDYLVKSSNANRLSLTLKCLIEIQSSTRNPGEDNPKIGRKEYEYLLAICNLIITWGRTRDAIARNIVKQEIEILPSGRVGINYSEFNYFSDISNEFRSVEGMVEIREPDFLTIYTDELELAYKEDYGYTLSEKFSVLQAVLSLTKENVLVHICNKDKLFTQIREKVPKISTDSIARIIDDSTLYERADFWTPPTGYERRDIFPWKFSRRNCFIRKPFIKVDNTLYWGSRNVSFLLHEELGLIYNEKLKTINSSKVKGILGKISKERSRFFNDHLYSVICSFDGFLVRKNVKKDSTGKRITDENGLDLGDIDILALDKKAKTVFVIEVKNYSFSRNNPDEIFSELSKLREFHKKHLRRVQWVASHKNETCKIFNTEILSNLKVKETMITRAPILARHLLNESANIIASYELSEKKLSLLKIVSMNQR